MTLPATSDALAEACASTPKSRALMPAARAAAAATWPTYSADAQARLARALAAIGAGHPAMAETVREMGDPAPGHTAFNQRLAFPRKVP